MVDMPEQQMKTKTLTIGKTVYSVGKLGVKALVANPPLYGIIYDDGREHMYCVPNETVQWTNEPVMIVVPETELVGINDGYDLSGVK